MATDHARRMLLDFTNVDRRSGHRMKPPNETAKCLILCTSSISCWNVEGFRGCAIWTGPALRCNGVGQVEAVNKAEIIKVLSTIWCNSEFYEGCCWGCAFLVAFHLAKATVCCCTSEFAGGVNGALCPDLETARPRGSNFNGFRSFGG
ncbi:hypothetical protein LWI28_013537 [Acer negundo]|uniref:Uncharacterized protein n=1 Tax=Acer negundo TaxID=4023 RepID=A0AAD5NFK1_ACENE|nr:hypothetical protein LWI28_013537 [Acer negundo]